MTEKERLMDRLFNDPKRRLLNFHITPGPGPFTEEELCASVNRAMDQIQEYTGSVDFDDDCPRTDVRAFPGSTA